MKKQFFRFVMVGGFAAAVNIGSRVVFSFFMGYLPAMICAFFVALSVAFIFNRTWVFKPSGKHWMLEAAWFTIINLLGLAQTLVISWWLACLVFPYIRMDYHPETVAHAIGVLTPIVTSYLGHKYLTFRNQSHGR